MRHSGSTTRGSAWAIEFVGVVEAVGADVTHIAPGDKVCSPFWISCGNCHFCRKGLQTSCVHGGSFGFQAF